MAIFNVFSLKLASLLNTQFSNAVSRCDIIKSFNWYPNCVRVTPLSMTKKFCNRGRKKVKCFAQVSLTKFLVDQIDKNVAMATSK